MAVRLYTNSFWVRAIPDRPAWDSGWDLTNTGGRFGLFLPTVDPITVSGNTSVTAGAAGTKNISIWGGVTAMLGSDQTIAGTVKGQFLMREAATACDAMVQMSIRVLQPDGSIRGTLLALHSAGAVTRELSTTSRNAKTPYNGPASLSSLSCLKYDRLLVEIGVRKFEAAATSRQYQFRNGSEGSTGDLPEDETTTATTYIGWIEFSQDIDFAEAPNLNSIHLMGVGA